MDLGYIRCFVVFTACLLCHVQGAFRDVLTLCNSDLEPVNRTAFDINFGMNRAPSSGIQHQQCTCRMMAYETTLLDVRLHLPEPEYNFDGEGVEGLNRPPNQDNTMNSGRNATCNPFIMVARMGRANVAKCMAAQKTDNGARMSLAIAAGNFVHVTLHNHKQLEIEPNLQFTVMKGGLSVKCYSEFQSDIWGSDSCPCEPVGMVMGGAGSGGGGGLHRQSDTSNSQRLVAGLVSVAVFLVIIAAIALFVWFRKRNSGSQKDLETNPDNIASENPAFTSSRSSGLDRSAAHPDPKTQTQGPIYSNVGTPGQKIPFIPDPSLDLDMQTVPTKQGKGSTDSGVYSMPADKNMVNNNGRYANMPIPPDQMYNPMLNAKQSSTASLTGQGALHGSTEQLDPSALYARPNKPSRNPVDPNPAPTRSASHDALNRQPRDGDLEQARSRSHNASMASMGSTVETDV